MNKQSMLGIIPGTDPYNLVQLDDEGKLPILDGNNLTNLPIATDEDAGCIIIGDRLTITDGILSADLQDKVLVDSDDTTPDYLENKLSGGNGINIVSSSTPGNGYITISATGGDITTDGAWVAVGDLIVGTGEDTASILTKGTEGQFLKTGSETLEWAAVSGGSEGASAAFSIQRSLEGDVYETTLMYWTAPVACTIDSVNMYLSSAPSAASSYCTVQVMKNGILETDSIFSSDAAMAITENTSAVNGIYPASGTLDTGNDMDDLAAGDVVHFRVNQADTGSADLLIQMMITVV